MAADVTKGIRLQTERFDHNSNNCSSGNNKRVEPPHEYGLVARIFVTSFVSYGYGNDRSQGDIRHPWIHVTTRPLSGNKATSERVDAS